MFFTSTSSLSFLLCFALLVSDSIVFGKPDVFSQKALKQMILSGLKKVSDACDNVYEDFKSKCPEYSSIHSCSDMVNYVLCIIDVVETDCGKDAAKQECDYIMLYLNQYGNPCKIECSVGLGQN